MNDRIREIQQWLQIQNIDAALLTSSDNIFYCSNFYSQPYERVIALFIDQTDAPILFCPQMEVHEAKTSGWSADIIGYTDDKNPWECISKEITKRALSPTQLAIEKSHVTVQRLEQIQHYFNTSTFISIEEILQELRMVKTENEIIKIKEACQLADLAMEIGVNELSLGKTEISIVAAIEYEMKKLGLEMSFPTMVLTGRNAASPHGTPGDTKIKRGDLIIFDLGIMVDRYCSDITRTVAYGDISDEQANIYTTVLQAQEAAIAKCTPGITCNELDQTARQFITSRGFGSYFPHRLGHGLGISIHEYPSLVETNTLSLKEGMIFTIEPGIYVPNVAGVRIEDDILITKNGNNILTKFPKELKIIN